MLGERSDFARLAGGRPLHCFLQCDGHVSIKSNGRLEEAPSRGARLWVYLWRNLTHR
jgi:hypothetical protein